MSIRLLLHDEGHGVPRVVSRIDARTVKRDGGIGRPLVRDPVVHQPREPRERVLGEARLAGWKPRSVRAHAQLEDHELRDLREAIVSTPSTVSSDIASSPAS